VEGKKNEELKDEEAEHDLICSVFIAVGVLQCLDNFPFRHRRCNVNPFAPPGLGCSSRAGRHPPDAAGRDELGYFKKYR
jgi:hypothetical protein